jgi:predicted SPOUT superfamily RNA methylase MTH1
VAGLEATVKASTDLGVSEAKTHSLFDVWLNVCPDQGSRTIRTEEAILITLARLRPLIRASGMPDKPAA